MDDPTASPGVALITGASRGLGAGIAARLAGTGWRLGLCARTRPDAPAASAAVCTASVDVTDPAALEAFAHRVTDEIGAVDLWISNAGVLDPIAPLRDAPVDALTTHLAVNLHGVVFSSRIFAGLVHDRDRPGTLVNISSGAARSVYQGWSVYGATKAGVDQLTRIVAAEEAPFGLRAFSVAPGVVDTAMQEKIRATPAERFPSVDRFLHLAEQDAFNSPAWVADRIVELHRAGSGETALPRWAASSPDPVVVRIPDEPR